MRIWGVGTGEPGNRGAQANRGTETERDGPEKSTGFGREATRGLLLFAVHRSSPNRYE